MPGKEMNFTYNSQDQLVQSKRGPPAGEVITGSYDYNAAGLRVRHKNSDRGDIDYYYDGTSVIEERNDGDNTLVAHYNYADRLLSLSTQQGTQYYLHDALGSTVNLTGQTGNTQVSYLLDPWGHIKDQIGVSVNRQIFTGQEHDPHTGLIYFGARYYDPGIARFITQDPYLGETSTPPSLHRYLYAYSNPTVYIDLFGYASWYETYWKDPLNVAADYYKEKLHKGEYSNAFTQALGAGTETLIDVTQGVLSSPVMIGEQIGMFAAKEDRNFEDIPILGDVGKNLGISAAKFAEKKNFENGVQLFGATSAAFLTVAPMLPKSPKPAMQGASASQEAAVTMESTAGTAITDTSQTVLQKAVQKIKNTYEASPLGNEIGAVGKDIRAGGTGRINPSGPMGTPLKY
jgi:RHS repeat-associated protein